MCHRLTSHSTPCPQIVLLASATKIFACSARHDTCAESTPSRGMRTCARGPPSSSNARPRADVARLTLRVVRAFLDRDRDGLRTLLISVVLFGAAASIFLQISLWPPFQCAPGAARSSVSCSGCTPRRRVGQWVAQAAQHVRIISGAAPVGYVYRAFQFWAIMAVALLPKLSQKHAPPRGLGTRPETPSG